MMIWLLLTVYRNSSSPYIRFIDVKNVPGKIKNVKNVARIKNV